MSSAPPEKAPRREPWPYALAAMLLSMIAVSLAFFAVAVLNPDPDVRRQAVERSFADELSIPVPGTAKHTGERAP